MPKQIESWSEMQVYTEAIAKKVAELPPPPTPEDSWSEKINTLNRTVESIREQVSSRIQAEEEMM